MSIVSLEDINAQIQQLEAQRLQLQAEAEKQRKEAMASVIQELIEKIETYGISAKDLGLSIGKAGKDDKAQRVRKPLGAKVAGTGKTYTGPDGQTW
ncbi:MAG: H-NS histone family protein, partial [Oxalobacteraceae bacterium]